MAKGVINDICGKLIDGVVINVHGWRISNICGKLVDGTGINGTWWDNQWYLW